MEKFESMNVGITGHQNIGSYPTIEWVKKELEILIAELAVTHGHTCLAKGADQVFAELLLASEISYTAIIPAQDYLNTFVEEPSKQNYLRLRKCASNLILIPFEHSSSEAYYSASKKVVEFSDVVFAVWDGKPSKGLGGTADVVSYAKKLGKQIVHLHTLKMVRFIIN